MSTTCMLERIALTIAEREVPIADELMVELTRLVVPLQSNNEGIAQLFTDELVGALRRIALRMQATAQVSVEKKVSAAALMCCDCGGYDGDHKSWRRSTPLTWPPFGSPAWVEPVPRYDPDDYRDLTQHAGV